MTDVTSVPPPGAATPEDPWERQRRWRRAFFNGVRQWQSMIAALIALGAATVAWQLTQNQIRIQNRQADAAQRQSMIAYADLMSRLIADLNTLRNQLEDLRGIFYVLHPRTRPTIRWEKQGVVVETPEHLEQRREATRRAVVDLHATVARIHTTAAATEVGTFVSNLKKRFPIASRQEIDWQPIEVPRPRPGTPLPPLEAIDPNKLMGFLGVSDDAFKEILQEFADLDKKLASEINVATARLQTANTELMKEQR